MAQRAIGDETGNNIGKSLALMKRSYSLNYVYIKTVSKDVEDEDCRYLI